MRRLRHPLCTAATVAALAVAAAFASPALAQSRCAQLTTGVGAWASCLETRASSYATARIDFTDGHSEYLSPQGTYVNLAPYPSGGFTHQEGYNYGTYSGFNLTPADGPLLQVDYHVASGGSQLATSYDYDPQLVTPAYLAGGYSQPTLYQISDMATSFGVNKAAVELTGTVEPTFTISSTNTIHPGFSGTVTPSVLGSAQSIWRDTATFSASGQAIFNVAIDGTMDASSWWNYSLTAIDGNGVSQSITGSFAGQGNPGSTLNTLTGTLNVVAGQHYLLDGALAVYLSDGTGVTDFYSTAKITSIQVAVGNTVSFASNSADWNGVVTTVPEPDVTAMLLAGLGILGFTARRRRNA